MGTKTMLISDAVILGRVVWAPIYVFYLGATARQTPILVLFSRFVPISVFFCLPFLCKKRPFMFFSFSGIS